MVMIRRCPNYDEVDYDGALLVPDYLLLAGDSVVVGEQEQASSVCNSQGLNERPNISGSRVTYFRYNGNGRFTPIALSRLGTRSQSIIAYHGGYAVAGANHDVFGAVDPALNMWLLDASGGNLGPSSNSTLTPGNYHVGSLYSSHYCVNDGGVFTSYWGLPPAAEAFPENGNPIGANPWQQFTFAASGSRFTICDVANGACLTDDGGAVEIGLGTRYLGPLAPTTTKAT
jgi:hypothetical protein